MIISNNGASGVYPGSTDLAYQQAIDDGVDIIDCSVQMSKDGIAFCSNSVDLLGDTTAMTKFMSRTSNIPELQPKSGIFSFDLTWAEIQTLKRNTSTELQIFTLRSSLQDLNIELMVLISYFSSNC